MQAADGLDVVVEDLRPGGEHGAERFLLDAEEVGRQHLDARLGQLRLDRADRGREVAGAAVGHVVAVDGRDDDVLQLHLRSRLADTERLEWVGRVLGLAGVDVAVAAGAGARVAEDLERRGAATPALGDVRAARLLADRVQREPVQQLLDVEVAAVRARRAHLHPVRAAGPLGDGKRRFHGPESRCAPPRTGRAPVDAAATAAGLSGGPAVGMNLDPAGLRCPGRRVAVGELDRERVRIVVDHQRECHREAIRDSATRWRVACRQPLRTRLEIDVESNCIGVALSLNDTLPVGKYRPSCSGSRTRTVLSSSRAGRRCPGCCRRCSPSAAVRSPGRRRR